MKNCWKILDIEETTDVDIIRRAYLALLPSFHPETDPQGFKQLRQAYEEALRIAQSPAKSVWQPEEYEVAEHEILLAFRALLASDSERFLPSAWQRFIQQLNYCSMEEIDELRWSLCTIAMNTAHLSFECVVLLAERLRWLQEENTGEIDEEELESFLYAIAKGMFLTSRPFCICPLPCKMTPSILPNVRSDLVIASTMADIVFSATSRSDYPR